VIAEFASPVEAVRCATEIQLELGKRNTGLSEARRMHFRIGVNLGDIMVDGDNLFGDGVNVAARLEGMARPGGLCISDTVLSHVRDRLGLEFEDLGPREVKNVPHPVRVYRVPLASEYMETSPFRGLRVFEFEHADIFHGRTRVIAKMLERLEQQAAAGTAFILVYGMSGSGKSSLVRAGLLPAITKRETPEGPECWRRCVFRPSQAGTPLLALVRALLSKTALPQLEHAITERDLLNDLREAPQRAIEAIQEALGRSVKEEQHNHGLVNPLRPRLVVVVDQLEELLTTESIDNTARAAFVGALAALARSGCVWVVATIRSDFFHRCSEIPELSDLKDGLGSYELLPPSSAEIGQIIRNPARTAGLRFEEDREQGRLEDVLQQAASRDPASLPLLEFMLDALYEAGKDRRALTFAAYHALGGLEGAIAHRADDVTGALPQDIQEALPAVLRALTTIRLRDLSIAALPSPRTELAATPIRVALVDALIQARLLVSDEGPDGNSVIRLAHEALLSHWPRAREIVAANREFLEARARVQAEAQRWLAKDRNQDFLLPPGKRLAEAEDLLVARRGELEGHIVEYIDTSAAAQRAREEADRRAERERQEAQEAAKRERVEREAEAARRLAHRTRIAAIVTVVLAILAGIGAVAGFLGQQEAKQQAAVAQQNAEQARNAEEQAIALRDEALRGQSLYLADLSRRATTADYTTSGMLLALEALPRDMGNPDRPYMIEAEAALYEALSANREHSVLAGHGVPVLQAAFSPDGSRIVTASADKTARVWDAATGKALAVLRGHDDLVSSAEFSPDGKYIVTASRDQTARLWDAADGTEIATMRGHKGHVRRARFSPSGDTIVTASNDHTAILWETPTGEMINVLRGHSDRVRAVAFSPDSRHIVTGSLDLTVRLWDAATGEETAVLSGHQFLIRAVAFGPKSERVVTASLDGTARLWDTADGSLIGVLRGHDERLEDVAFSPDGKSVVTASEDQTARMWDATTGAGLTVLRGHDGTVESVAFSTDSRWIVTGSSDRTARLWDPNTGEEIAVLRGHNGAVQHVAVSSDNRLITTASHDGTARVWLADRRSNATVLRGHRRQVSRTMFSPDGGRVVTASHDGTARIWDAASGAEIKVLQSSEPIVWEAMFSPNGRRVITVSSNRRNETNRVRVWDTQSGTEIAVLGIEGPRPQKTTVEENDRSFSGISAFGGAIRASAIGPDHNRVAVAENDNTVYVWDAAAQAKVSVLRGHERAVTSISLSLDGGRAVTASKDHTARLWNVESGSEIAVLIHTAPVLHAAFSADGNRVITNSEAGEVRIWNASDGAEITSLKGLIGSRIRHVAISSDGSRVITTAGDNMARVWDAALGTEITVLRGHRGPIQHAMLSRDEARIITASDDGSVRLWDAATGAELSVLGVHTSWVNHVAFDPSGTRIVTASTDQTAQIINVFPSTQALIDHARSVVSRELTQCERKRYFLSVQGTAENCPK
jgi:WD40 repeat protein